MKTGVQAVVSGICGLAIVGFVLFYPAGTFHYWQAWVFIAAFTVATIVPTMYLGRTDPAALQRRMKAGPKAETRTVQKVIIVAAFLSVFAMMALSALDHRFGWTSVPAWLVLVGDALVIAGLAMAMFVVTQNSYAAATVTVEAGQPVVSSGLYGVVRHPMYVGNLLLMVGTPLGQAAGHRDRSTVGHRRRTRRRCADPRRNGVADQRLPSTRRDHPTGAAQHPSLQQGRSAEAPPQEVDVLAAVPVVTPAQAGDLLRPDRLGVARPRLVDRAGLRRGQRRLPRLRQFRRHRRPAVAAGSGGHLRRGAMVGRAAVERWTGRHARGVVPGDHPVRGGRSATAGTAGDLPVGRLHRRLPRPDVPGRYPRVRVRGVVVTGGGTQQSAELRHGADAGRSPAARRLLGAR